MSAVTSVLEIPKEPATRRAWILFRLKLKGISLNRIALEIGVGRQSVSDALYQPSAHIEESIAAKLGIPVRDLFPERFDSLGNRLHRTRSPQRSTQGAGHNVQVRGRA